MKYIYGSNWPHKCSCCTCESNYMDQLWRHQPNDIDHKGKNKTYGWNWWHMNLQSWISQLYELTHGWKMNVMHEHHNVKEFDNMENV